MHEPWGIADPDFLRIYTVGLALTLLAAFAARILVRGPRIAERPGPLTPDELAYLRGGPHHVVESAVTRLVDRGHLQVHATGAVRVASDAAGSGLVDSAVLRAAGRPDTDTVGTVIDLVIQSDAVAQLRDRLVRKGLLVDARAAAVRIRHGLLPLGLLLAAGTMRWVDGVGDGRLDGPLAIALIATAGAGRMLLTIRPTLTFLGTRFAEEPGAHRWRPVLR